MALTREAILGAQDLPKREVEVQEWGGSVYVQALDGQGRDKLERMLAKDDVSRAAIAALCIVDEKGERLFTEKDVDALAKKNGTALERVVTAAMSYNHMTDEALTEAGND